MENMRIYEKSKACPENALRTIQAGKLKGKSDINPVWRIKQLTELFGPCGIGWRLTNIKYWTEPGAGGEVSAWCSLVLQYRLAITDPWSDGVEGIGGSMLVTTEKGRLVTNDEAYKMAQTDAISVACKMLGFAADVYWNADSTKYTGAEPEPEPEPKICEGCHKPIVPVKHSGNTVYSVDRIAAISKESYGKQLCWACMKAAKAETEAPHESTG